MYIELLLTISSVIFAPSLVLPQQTAEDASEPSDAIVLRKQIAEAMALRVATTKSARYRTVTTLHAFPDSISSFFDDVSPRLGPQRYQYNHSGARLDGSFLVTIERLITYPDFATQSDDISGDTTVSSYDAIEGEYKGTTAAIVKNGNDFRIHAAIDSSPDPVTADDRLAYWFSGVSSWQGVNIPDTVAANISEAELTTEKDGLITAKFSLPVTGQPLNIADIEITFDPFRHFMPVKYKYTRTNKKQGGEVIWMEGLRVSEAMKIEGIWMPKMFDTIQSNMSGEIAPIVYHTVVEELAFSGVSRSDVDFKFPAGARVVDRIREQWYISGEGGEPAKTPVPLLIGPRVDGASGYQFASRANYNWAWKILFINIAAVIVAIICYFCKKRTADKK